MELSHQIMDSFYDIGVTKIRTARDKGRGTGDKRAANTAYTARDEGQGTRDKGTANTNEK